MRPWCMRHCKDSDKHSEQWGKMSVKLNDINVSYATLAICSRDPKSQLSVPLNVYIPIWADAECLSDKTKPELNKHLRHSYFSPFFLSTRLKCNSDVSAESLYHMVQFFSLSRSGLLSLFSRSLLFLLFSLLLLYRTRHCSEREREKKRWHFLSCPSCPLWSACHFGSSVVTAASTAEQCAEQLTVKSR